MKFIHNYNSNEIISNLRWSLGGSVSDVSYGIWNGSIDLNETYININGNAWFGTSFSRVKLHSPTAIAYTKVGNPTITSDGIASGFTDKTDYLTLGSFNPGTAKWKFTTKVKIYDYTTQISLIDRNSSTRCFQIVVRTTGKFRVNISTNGSSKANEVDGTHVLSINTIYYICFEYDGSKYYLKYSLDNINWVTDITINNSTKIYPVSSMCMGHSWYNSGTEKWNGEIYLRYTRFEIDGVTNDKYKLHALEGDYAIVDGRLVWANPDIYLQSSGTQYIDTGFKPDSNTRVDVLASNINNYDSLFGVNPLIVLTTGNSKLRYRWNNTSIDAEGNTGTFYLRSIDKGAFKQDGVVVGTVTQGEWSSSYNAFLFARCSSTGTVQEPMKAKVKCCKIWNNGTLVRYLVPVPTGLQIGDFTVPSNGMFDIVEQKFYPNQGTGTFTYGKDE